MNSVKEAVTNSLARLVKQGRKTIAEIDPEYRDIVAGKVAALPDYIPAEGEKE